MNVRYNYVSAGNIKTFLLSLIDQRKSLSLRPCYTPLHLSENNHVLLRDTNLQVVTTAYYKICLC